MPTQMRIKNKVNSTNEVTMKDYLVQPALKSMLKISDYIDNPFK